MKFIVLLFLIVLCAPVSAQQNTDCEEAKKRLAGAEKRLSDWAQISRFAEANGKIAPPRLGEDRVVFLGDSITDSWDDGGFGEFFPGKPYINRGISGQTTPQMLVRFRPDVIALRPKVVVILAGTNDIAGNTGFMSLQDTADNIASMAELARANGIRVVLASVLPVNDRLRNKEGVPLIQTQKRPNEKIVAMNEWLKKYAAENELVYLDYFSAMVDGAGTLKDGLSYDGLHPDAEGYKVMQPLAEKAISAALGKK